jgi:hypothetical protein
LAREGVPLIVIQRQLGHSNLGITSVYLQGIDNAEIIETVHARPRAQDPSHSAPQPLACAHLRLWPRGPHAGQPDPEGTT